jgi:predicted 3-demethylubiquinone-9 3-methyltransferase (glyoxalase superfamily)
MGTLVFLEQDLETTPALADGTEHGIRELSSADLPALDSRVDRVTPLLAETPSGPPGSVKVVDFTFFGQRFQAITAGPHHEFNDAISLVVLCDDQAELDRYWNALLEGGGKPQACGWLIDRYGLRWQIVPAILDEMMSDKDPARAKRVTEALLKMVKLDIAALQKAYRS